MSDEQGISIRRIGISTAMTAAVGVLAWTAFSLALSTSSYEFLPAIAKAKRELLGTINSAQQQLQTYVSKTADALNADPWGAEVLYYAPLDENRIRLEYARVLSYGKQFSKAEKEYRTLLEKDPANRALQAEVARLHLWSGDIPTASAQLEGFSEEELDRSGIEILQYSFALNRKFPELIGLLRRALKKYPNDPVFMLSLAEALSWNKEFDESLGWFQRLLSHRPDDQQLRRKYALTLSWAGRHSEAAKEFAKTLAGEQTSKPTKP